MATKHHATRRYAIIVALLCLLLCVGLLGVMWRGEKKVASNEQHASVFVGPPLSELASLSPRAEFHARLAKLTPGVTTEDEIIAALGMPIPVPFDSRQRRDMHRYVLADGSEEIVWYRDYLLSNQPYPFSMKDWEVYQGIDGEALWGQIERRAKWVHLGMTRKETELWFGHFVYLTDSPNNGANLRRRSLELMFTDEGDNKRALRLVGFEWRRWPIGYGPEDEIQYRCQLVPDGVAFNWWEHPAAEMPMARWEFLARLAALPEPATLPTVVASLGGPKQYYDFRVLAAVGYETREGEGGEESLREELLFFANGQLWRRDLHPLSAHDYLDLVAYQYELKREPLLREMVKRLRPGMELLEAHWLLGIKTGRPEAREDYPTPAEPAASRLWFEYDRIPSSYYEKHPELLILDFDEQGRLLRWRSLPRLPPSR